MKNENENINDDLELKRKMPQKIAQRFEDLPSDWKKIIYDLASDGASDTTMYTNIALTRRKHESLQNNILDYAEWFGYCSEVSLAWWEDFSKKMCLRKDYNSSTYALRMRNKAGWSNNDPKPSAPLELPIQDEEPTKSLEDFKPKLKIANN